MRQMKQMRNDDTDSSVWSRAIQALVFMILRCFMSRETHKKGQKDVEEVISFKEG